MVNFDNYRKDVWRCKKTQLVLVLGWGRTADATLSKWAPVTDWGNSENGRIHTYTLLKSKLIDWLMFKLMSNEHFDRNFLFMWCNVWYITTVRFCFGQSRGSRTKWTTTNSTSVQSKSDIFWFCLKQTFLSRGH